MGWIRYQHEVGEEPAESEVSMGAERRLRLRAMSVAWTRSTAWPESMCVWRCRHPLLAGEAYKNDATETVTFFRPSEYEGIKDKDVRRCSTRPFPMGWRCGTPADSWRWFATAECRKHVKIVHPYPGDGQNREAIGTNYLPLQKVLNANISLLDRYFRNAIARRFALEPYIDTQSSTPSPTTPPRSRLLPDCLRV